MRAIRDAFLSRLRDALDQFPAGSVESLAVDLHPETVEALGFDRELADDFVVGGRDWVLALGVRAQGDDGDATSLDARLLLVQAKHVRERGRSLDFPRSLRNAVAAAQVCQPALPGLDDLAGRSFGPPDRDLLVSAAMLEGLRTETFSSLRDRITEIMSAIEVPVRALRNPGKVLGELAARGEVARVTSHGKVVGWLMPATEAEQHLDDLVREGRLRRGTPAPIEPIEVDGLERPLSELLSEARDGERT